MVDFKGTEHEFYHKYKDKLGVNAGQVINLNNWMWYSFFKLSRLYKQGKLPRYEFYHKYKDRLGVNAGQVINLNNWMWYSFFKLSRLYKQGKLPRFYRKPSPPGFWKDRLLGKRLLRILVRNDRYYIEPINNGEGYLVLKDWGLRIKYAGKIK